MEDLNDILKLSGLKTKTVKKNLNESYTNEPDEKYAPVDAILDQGTDLNRKKQQNAVAGFTGDNPMTEGGADVDEDAVRELKIYIDHDPDLYKQNVEPILRNLSRKWDKGVYDHELAQKLFYYLTVNGAKQYGQQHSNGDGLRIFSPDVRKAVAKELADDWLAELKAGNKMDEAEVDLEEMLADILISEDAFDNIRDQSDKAFSSIRKSSDSAFSSIRGKKPGFFKKPGDSNADNRERQITGTEKHVLGGWNPDLNPSPNFKKFKKEKSGKSLSDIIARIKPNKPTEPSFPGLGKKPEYTDMIPKPKPKFPGLGKKEPEYVTPLPVRPGDKFDVRPLEEAPPPERKPKIKPNDAAGYGDETGGPDHYVNPEIAKQMADQEAHNYEMTKLQRRFPEKVDEIVGTATPKKFDSSSLAASAAFGAKTGPGVKPVAKGPAASPFNVSAGGVANMGGNAPKPVAKGPAASPFNVSAGGVANMGGNAPKPVATDSSVAKAEPKPDPSVNFTSANYISNTGDDNKQVAQAAGQGGYGQGKATTPPPNNNVAGGPNAGEPQVVKQQTDAQQNQQNTQNRNYIGTVSSSGSDQVAQDNTAQQKIGTVSSSGSDQVARSSSSSQQSSSTEQGNGQQRSLSDVSWDGGHQAYLADPRIASRLDRMVPKGGKRETDAMGTVKFYDASGKLVRTVDGQRAAQRARKI